jgi:hypothetical protein
MVRRLSTLSLGAILMLAAGCRWCHNQPGCLTSGSPGGAPCQLTGTMRPGESCYDAITGMPIPCPPQAPTMVIPGGGYPYDPGLAPGVPGTRPDELPFPGPSDMIPRQGVPFAPPSAAPGDGTVGSKTGQPGKTGSNK